MISGYETVIGLEIHVELNTRTKLFCGCLSAFGGVPNTRICPVCMGLPGSLPVLNRKVLSDAAAVGLALKCDISPFSRFDRKNYFYPDNPQNYQISQLYFPICTGGELEIFLPENKGDIPSLHPEGTGKRIRIREIHMEEDAGKLIHSADGSVSLVDYNRAGVPLLEIVTEPDLRSGEEAAAFLRELMDRIRYLGVSDCRLQEGSMRVDVNLSLRPPGSVPGVRTEMKNLNSFQAIRRAVAAEEKRQAELLDSGGRVEQETRRWDEGAGRSFVMRGKEDARDYRYFPEPDLPPLSLSREETEKIRASLPEFRRERAGRFEAVYGLSSYDAWQVTAEREMAVLFEETVSLTGLPKEAANWLMGEGLRLMKLPGEKDGARKLRPAHFAAFLKMLEEGRVTRTSAKEIFEAMYLTDADPEKYAADHALGIVREEGALRELVRTVVRSNPKSVSDYRGGKKKALGFLVGQVMKASGGTADPGEVNRILSETLEDA